MLTRFVFLCNGEGAGSTKHYQVQKGVSTQSVSAVDAGTGRLTTGIQSRNYLIGSISMSDDLMGEDLNHEWRSQWKNWACRHVTYLSFVVCGYSTHIIVNSRQDRDGLFGNVNPSKDHGSLWNARKPGGQLLRREVVELEVHVVFLWTNTPEGAKRSLKFKKKKEKDNHTYAHTCPP